MIRTLNFVILYLIIMKIYDGYEVKNIGNMYFKIHGILILL
jgi:hypothetical protein